MILHQKPFSIGVAGGDAEIERDFEMRELGEGVPSAPLAAGNPQLSTGLPLLYSHIETFSAIKNFVDQTIFNFQQVPGKPFNFVFFWFGKKIPRKSIFDKSIAVPV